MTGYYPILQPDELVDSASAASLAIFLGDSNLYRERKRLMGLSQVRFGGIIPSNCRALQSNVPALAGLSDEVILDGSAYHIVAPTLLSNERERLRRAIFEGHHRLIQEMFPGYEAPYWRYCVECAREDHANGRRQCWRILPNIPGVNTCDRHGILLVQTVASAKGWPTVHSATDWIDLDGPRQKSLNDYDLQLVKDLRWLYRLKSSLCPGWKSLASALSVILAEVHRYRRSRHFLDLEAIAGDLWRIREGVEHIAPRLFNRVSLSKILHQRERPSVAVYSLLAKWVGIDMKRLFTLASDPAVKKSHYIIMAEDRMRFRTTSGLDRLRAVKTRLRNVLAETPEITRTQLFERCSEEVRYALRRAPLWFAKEMPLAKRGFKNQLEWKFRDQYYYQILSEKVASGQIWPRRKRVGAKTLLRMAGMPAFLLINAKGRLPRTLRLMNDLLRRQNGTLPYRSGKRCRSSERCM